MKKISLLNEIEKARKICLSKKPTLFFPAKGKVTLAESFCERFNFEFERKLTKTGRVFEIFKITKGGSVLVKIEKSGFLTSSDFVAIFNKILKIEK